MEVPVEENLILTEEKRQLHGTLKFAADVHRKMRQPILESLSVTDEEKTRRDAREGDPEADVKQARDTVKDTVKLRTMKMKCVKRLIVKVKCYLFR
jgi:hypothetical protein